MDRLGQGRRVLRVIRVDDGVAHHDHGRARRNAGLEGHGVPGVEDLLFSRVFDDGPVGVARVAVTGVMLETADDFGILEFVGHILGEVRDFLRVRAEGPVVDVVLLVIGDVDHRRQVRVEAEDLEERGLLLGVRDDAVPSASVEDLLGTGELLVPVHRETRDAVHGSTLFIDGEQHADLRHFLERRHVGHDTFRCVVLEILREEDVSAELVFLLRRDVVLGRMIGQDHLPHFLFEAHLVELRLHGGSVLLTRVDFVFDGPDTFDDAGDDREQ